MEMMEYVHESERIFPERTLIDNRLYMIENRLAKLEKNHHEHENGWSSIPEESARDTESPEMNHCCWDSTIKRLSEGLEIICSQPNTPQSSPFPSPSSSTLQKTRNRKSMEESIRISAAFCHPLDDDLDLQFWQPVKVRHEETQDSLNRSLAMICRNNSPTTSQQNCSDQQTNGHIQNRECDQNTRRISRLKETSLLKKLIDFGIKFRLDITGKNPQKLAVSVDGNDHFLRIFSTEHSTVETIHLLQLGMETRIQTLACTIGDGFLSIRERPKDVVFLQYDGISDKSLPIVTEDETKFVVTINLFVPKELQSDDLTVKTIDNVLVIKGAAKQLPNDFLQTSQELLTSEGKSFRVAINLPNGTFTRTIKAWISAEGQLLIRGHMAPTSRRMTCNF